MKPNFSETVRQIFDENVARDAAQLLAKIWSFEKFASQL